MRWISLFLVPTVLLIGSAILSQTTVKNPHGKLSWDCQDCHTTESWSQMRDTLIFDHTATGFNLLGAHATAPCISCHKSPIFSNVGVSCGDCHSDHHKGELGNECQTCHTPRDWENRRGMLDLHASRGFALTGAHAVADCEACHTGHDRREYAGTAVECYDCHSEAYAATAEPNHPQAGFSHDCRLCHSAALSHWQYADYSHPASFPLSGGHKGIACEVCHQNGYAGTVTDCYSCHSTDFAGTTDPDHQTSGFGHECMLCHTTAAWQPARYDHSATAFPLTGAHLRLNCVSCHATQYAGTPTDCYACHQSSFESVTDPNHVQSGFSHVCLTCHTTNGWTPSSFDHSSTGFQLTGAHATAQCLACHASGYSGTPSNCYACHQTAYDATSNPSHTAAGFPVTCETCHSANAWTPSSWNHDALYFPINSGAHSNVACAECHVTPSSYATFECILCHQHERTTTDTKHSSVQDYQYLSSACYACHPRGTH